MAEVKIVSSWKVTLDYGEKYEKQKIARYRRCQPFRSVASLVREMAGR